MQGQAFGSVSCPAWTYWVCPYESICLLFAIFLRSFFVVFFVELGGVDGAAELFSRARAMDVVRRLWGCQGVYSAWLGGGQWIADG